MVFQVCGLLVKDKNENQNKTQNSLYDVVLGNISGERLMQDVYYNYDEKKLAVPGNSIAHK